MNPIEHIGATNSIDELVKAMKNAAFGARRLGEAVDILEEMCLDKDCTKQIIIDMLGLSDAFVTTGANLTHDLAEALGYRHYQGSASVDDAALRSKGIDRIYDSYMPDEAYKGIEKFCMDAFERLPDREMGTKEFLWEIGKSLGKGSILNACYEKEMPVFCPALADSGIGLQVWNYNNVRHGESAKQIHISTFEDLREMMDIAWSSKRSGFFYVGGGVPKNFIQQAMQFSKPASYGVQIRMDRQEYGGSSGAELRESVSWGKLEKDAKHADIVCDATIALPVIHAALLQRLKMR